MAEVATKKERVKPKYEGDWVFVIRGTRAWNAWRSVGKMMNYAYPGTGEHAGKTGRHMPSLFPPGHPDATDAAWEARNSPQSALSSQEPPIVAE